jgi:myo-inositol 2-dehydrogenase/D-chiro-inositol 1-dehydrogenase
MKSPPPLSRRQFLATAGVSLAAASTLSRAIAQGSTANSRIKIGLVGCGSRGMFLLNLLQENGSYEIAAVADYFADRVQLAGEKYHVGAERRFTGLKCAEKMIAHGGLDAVAIISPPYFHPEQARAAVNASLHVYLAKPVAVDVPGCHSITESNAIAPGKGLVFLVDFQTRANEFFIEAIRRVQAGAIGDICFGESVYHAERLKAKAPAGAPPHEARLRNWVFDQALSGNIIVEQNIHTLDVMSWAMKDSPPVRCTGTGGRRVRIDVGDAWDHYALTYEYPNSVGVTFSSRQFDAHGEPGGIINRMFGTQGVLQTKYGGDVLIRGGKETFYRGGATTAIYKEGVIENLKAFHAAVLAKDTSNATVAPSVTSNLVAILGRTAAREKRTVTWTELVASKKKLHAELNALIA